jgi:uncharacterized integral membrane protein
MPSAFWPKVRIWTRVILFVLLLIYFLVFISENSGQRVNFWYWYNSRLQSPLLLFAFVTFTVGFLAALLIGMIFRTLSQLRQLQSAPTKAPVPSPTAPIPTTSSPPPPSPSRTPSAGH